ncbi:hypothetical protein [Armatimonas sp.]|uniref:hypothetical protein n=1 Tax=Armatimonas sp. TaxID=1872638 RepID=UPI00374FE3C3
MGNKDEEVKALQEAFKAEFIEHQKSEDATVPLRFLAEALEADTAGYKKRFKESALAMIGLVFLLIQFRDTPYEQWAFIIVPLGLAYAAQRVGSPKRPAILAAASETLLSPVLYTPEQQVLIRRIEEAAFGSERGLKTACEQALQQSA